MTALAKSDGTTLRDHTRHVVEAMTSIARALIPDISDAEYSTAIHAAILHDLGKAHPFFQASIGPGFDRSEYQFEVPHRHEISSLLFLPLFDTGEWSQIVDMVVAHHKSVRVHGNPKGRGLIDLVNDYGIDEVFDRHSEQIDVWGGEAMNIVGDFSIQSRSIPLAQMRIAFDDALRLCEVERRGRNRWRGLLMSADHLASALQNETQVRAESLFRPPDLTAFARRASVASADLFPLAGKSTESPKPHTLVVAPTGSGKTDYLLRRCREGRVFYLLPFQASINAMFLRLDSMLNPKSDERLPASQRTDIRRVHASAQIEIDGEIEEEMLLQRHPGAALKVMTPHQMASLIFGLAGHEAVALDVGGQNVILDEVHVYGEHAQAMVLALIRSLVRLKCKVHVGSATIPTSLATEIRRCLGGDQSIHEVRLSDTDLATFDRHNVQRLPDEGVARDFIQQKLENSERVLFISNRVASAQARYRWVRENIPNVPVLLIHSRFRRVDRAKLEKQIEEFDKKEGPCVVCSTQVIEVSLDISFDTLVTDCAPLDSLIQRFGRVNRRRKDESERTVATVGVIAPPSNEAAAKPYALDVLQRSWAVLPDDGPLIETSVQELIDVVYPLLDMTIIDVHVIESEAGVSLAELCNFPRSVLLEALEIDSASVIRISDLETYKSAKRDMALRTGLEIPVSVKSLRPIFGVWRQEETGSRPFVCPDRAYDEKLGLLIGSVEGDSQCTIL